MGAVTGPPSSRRRAMLTAATEGAKKNNRAGNSPEGKLPARLIGKAIGARPVKRIYVPFGLANAMASASALSTWGVAGSAPVSLARPNSNAASSRQR